MKGVDFVGAGDAFTAALMDGLGRGLDPAGALAGALAASAETLSRPSPRRPDGLPPAAG